MSTSNWDHIKDALPDEVRSEIHANALILREAVRRRAQVIPRFAFSEAQAEEVCIALYCALAQREREAQR